MKVHNLLVTGSHTSSGEDIRLISSSVATINNAQNTRLNSIESITGSLVSKTGSFATTGSNIFIGTQTVSGSIIPAVDNTYDLGSVTHQFRDLYLSSASLYIDGTKVLSSTTQELQITTDAGQSFKILEAGSDTITLQSNDGNITLATSGGGDVILDPTNGIIALKGTTTLYAGNRILSSDGNAIQIGNSVTMTGSLVVTGFIETQELRTTYISSSILYRSGSTKFGDDLDDTHSFTGSLTVSGSINVPGSGLVSGSSQITYSGLNGVPSGIISGSAQLPSGVVSGSVQVDVMSTTNIARLATTGSNTFSGIQTFNTTTTENSIFNSPSNGGYITLKENDTIAGYLQWGLTLSGYSGGNYMLITSAENGGNIALQTRTTGGTYNNSALVINSSGNVGVNTPTPLEKLSVTGNLHVAGVGNNLYFDTDGSGRAISQYVSNLYEFNIVNGRGNSSRFILGNGSISLGTSGTAMFHINTTTGNVGIGTTSPNTKLELSDSSGNAGLVVRQSLSSANGRYAQVILSHGSTFFGASDKTYQLVSNGLASGEADFAVQYWNGSTYAEQMRITSAGNVGIGTDSPQGKLHINSGISDVSADIYLSSPSTIGNNGGTGAIYFGSGEGPGYTSAAIKGFSLSDFNLNDTPGYLTFSTTPDASATLQERIRITSDGDVRINHTGDFSATFSINKVAGRNIANFSNAVDADLTFTISEPGATPFARITPSVNGQPIQLGVNNNNVLIGTTSDTGAKLNVGGSYKDFPVSIEAMTGGNQLSLTRVGAVTEIYMGGSTAGTTAFYVRSGGSGGVVLTAGSTAWASASDIRLKDIEKPIENAVESLSTLQTVYYSWKDSEDKSLHIGFIAQEVEEVFPEVVIESSIDEMKGVKYTELIPVLVAAIKELKVENNLLKARLDNNNIN
jgi:hypothetical protein